MANTKTCGVLCMLLLTLLIQDFAEGSSRGASHGLVKNRKMFLELKKMALRNGLPKLVTNEMTDEWELRRVPAGPNPLHHNGQDPNKPRVP